MLGKLGDEAIEQIAGVGSLQRRDQKRIAEPQSVQLVGSISIDLAVGLVAHEDDRPPSPAEGLGNLLVEGRHAVAHIHHEAADVSLGDRHLRLLTCGPRERRDVGGGIARQRHVKPRGVHDGESLPAPLDDTVQPVPRQPREGIDDRPARAGEPVEQRRLADVGAADDRNDTDRRCDWISLFATAPASGAGRAHFPPPGTGEMSSDICANGAPSSSSAKALTSSEPARVVRQMM